MHILIQNKRRPYKISESHPHTLPVCSNNIERDRKIDMMIGAYLVLGPISLNLLALGKFRGKFWEPHCSHLVTLLVNTLVGAFVERSGTLSQSLILLARVVLTVGCLKFAPQHLVLVRHLLRAFLLERKISAVSVALTWAWVVLLWVLLGGLGPQLDVKVLVHQLDRVHHSHVLLMVLVFSPLHQLSLQVWLGIGARAAWHAPCFVGCGGLGAGDGHFFDNGCALGFPGVST